MGGCASSPKGVDLTKEDLPVDNPASKSPSKPAEAPQTAVAPETGNGGDVEKKEAVAVVDKAEEAKPEAEPEAKPEAAVAKVKTESPAEAVTEKKEVEKEVAVTTVEEKKAEAVVAPKVEAVVAPKDETAEKAAEPSKVAEKTDVSPVTTTA